jgi:hypothetical protein
MANHESARTTGLYDRPSDEISLDEVEWIGSLKPPSPFVSDLRGLLLILGSNTD